MSNSFYPILLILIGGGLTTYVWRFMGVWMSERVDPEGELLMWVRCVATAIVAALVAGIVLSPNAILASTGLEMRVAAIAAGVLAFYATGKNTGLGVAASVVVLFALALLS